MFIQKKLSNTNSSWNNHIFIKAENNRDINHVCICLERYIN